MTNYEKIMTDMTPEKLARTLNWSYSCYICAYRDKRHCGFHCLGGVEEWLKQEAKMEGENCNGND